MGDSMDISSNSFTLESSSEAMVYFLALPKLAPAIIVNGVEKWQAG
jgi:hypothetical protein